jgi:hypothetical protein
MLEAIYPVRPNTGHGSDSGSGPGDAAMVA